MLENSIKKYHNKILTAAEVIEELINLSKDIVEMDNEAKHMGLTDFEYAFYTAVANNDSARELMQQDKLRELAVVLTETIRQNASIDWTIKESVKAKLKVAVKRILRKYGYPPDMQMLATETVLKQAEMIANEITSIHTRKNLPDVIVPSAIVPPNLLTSFSNSVLNFWLFDENCANMVFKSNSFVSLDAVW
jgi:type I restriction enzyme, R subunit